MSPCYCILFNGGSRQIRVRPAVMLLSSYLTSPHLCLLLLPGLVGTYQRPSPSRHDWSTGAQLRSPWWINWEKGPLQRSRVNLIWRLVCLWGPLVTEFSRNPLKGASVLEVPQMPQTDTTPHVFFTSAPAASGDTEKCPLHWWKTQNSVDSCLLGSSCLSFSHHWTSEALQFEEVKFIHGSHVAENAKQQNPSLQAIR